MLPPGVGEATAESDDVSSNADDDSQLDNDRPPPHDAEHNDPSNNHDEQSQVHDAAVIADRPFAIVVLGSLVGDVAAAT